MWDDGSYDSYDDPQSGDFDSCSSLGGTWIGHVAVVAGKPRRFQCQYRADSSRAHRSQQTAKAGTFNRAGSGRPQIRISAGPAAQSRWSRDGTQLFYIAPDKKLMAVSFDPSAGRAGTPRGLFQTRIVQVSVASFQYDVAPDGRFLINSLPVGSPPLTLLAGCNSLFKYSSK